MSTKARKIIVLIAATGIGLVSLWIFSDVVSAGNADLGLSQLRDSGLGQQDIRVTVARIIRAALALLGVVAVILTLYAGYTWMTAGGNEEKITQAKRILRNTVIGLIIILSAYAIVSFVLSKLLEATTGIPAHCSNGVLDPGVEAGIDCGVECPACGGERGGWGSQGFYIVRRPQGGELCVRNVHPVLVFNRPVDLNSLGGIAVRQVSSSTSTIDNDLVDTASLSLVAGRWGYSSLERRNEVAFTPDGGCGSDAATGCLAPSTTYVIDIPHWGGEIRSADDPPRPLNCRLGDGCADVVFTTGAAVDAASPTIRMIYPNASSNVFRLGDTVSATLQFSDDAGVQMVSLQAEGQNVDAVALSGCQQSGEVSIPWRTAGWPGGEYTLEARAYDWSARQDSTSTDVILRPASCFEELLATSTAGLACPTRCGGECGSCEGASCSRGLDCASGWCQAGATSSACVNRMRITDVQPLSGAAGNYVSIYGCFFGTTTGQVYFGSAPTPAPSQWTLAPWPQGCPVYWRSSQIIATVPTMPAGAEGPLKVRTAPSAAFEDTTRDSFGRAVPDFRLTNEVRPGLCAVIPEQGRPEDLVELRGKNLPTSPVPARQVLFGNIPARQVGLWTISSIDDISVPWLQSGLLDVRVRQGDIASNGIRFRVSEGVAENTPFITEVSPARGARGEYITLRGRNFGNNRGYVYFKWKDNLGNQDAVVPGDFDDFPSGCGAGDIWRDNQIIVKFPREADLTARRGVEGREYNVIVASAGSGATSSPPNDDATFTLQAGIPRPGICRLEPSVAPIPFPPASTMRITGEYFTSDLLQNDLRRGLVLYYTFDVEDLNGGVVMDRSGRGAHGVNRGAEPADGKVGGAFRFSQDHFVEAGSSTRFSTGLFGGPGGEVTIAVWARPTAVDRYNIITSDLGGIGYLSGGSTAPVVGVSRVTTMVRSSTARLPYWQAVNSFPSSASTLRAGVWQHIVFVLRGWQGYEIYIDGRLDKTENVPILLSPFSGGNPYIGHYFSDSPGNVLRDFEGEIDDLRVYNRALSGAELSQLYRIQNNQMSPIAGSGVYFWAAGASPTSTRNRAPASTNPPFTISSLAPRGEQITLRPPDATETGPVVAARSENILSNPAQFTRQDCRTDLGVCSAPSRCCTVGGEAGLCKPVSEPCADEQMSAGYIWRFSTRDIPRAPRVVERCDSATEAGEALPTPSPSTLWDVGGAPDGAHHNVCRTALVTVEFSALMDRSTINASTVKVNQCSSVTGTECIGEAPITLSAESFELNSATEGASYIQLKPLESRSVTESGNTYSALWTDDAWYQVVLTTDIKSEGTTTSSMPLTADRPCDVTGSAYCFVFKTDRRNCTLREVVVTPYSYWTTYLEAPLRRHVGDAEYPLWYIGLGLSDQRCIMMDTSGYRWSWSSASTTYADIHPGSTSLGSNRAQVDSKANTVGIIGLNNPDDAVNIAATAATSTISYTGRSPLTIDLTHPEVEEFWPNCLEACPNADVGALFNVPMSDYQLGWSSVKLWRCADENCFSAEEVANGALSFQPNTEGSPQFRRRLEIPHNLLAPSTLYKVVLSSAVSSSPRLWSLANSTDPMSRTRPYDREFSWRFRTKEQLCRVDRVEVSPSSYTALRYNDRAVYQAEPFSSPDACSVSGQRLDAWGMSWRWGSSDELVATVFTTTTKGQSRFCTSACVKKGSDIPLASSGGALPVCGNNVVEAGEDCDLPGASSRCGLNCLRMGNERASATAYVESDISTHNLCGNGRVEPNAGETCDTADPATRVGCGANCLRRGTEPTTSARDVEVSICGNGSVGSGEDCDIGRTASRADNTSAMNCASNCLHTGTPLSISWWLNNASERGGFSASEYSAAGASARSQCGDTMTSPDEDDDCETGVYGARASFCNDYCLWNTPAHIEGGDRHFDCTPTSTGCTSLGQHWGSSLLYRVNGINTPSVCGDGYDGVGEDRVCEGNFSATRTPFVNPWAMAAGVGLSVDAVTGTPPAMRAWIIATTTEGGRPVSGSGEFIIPCGYSTDEQCSAYNTSSTEYAVGSNSCCYPRPRLLSVYPGSTTTPATSTCPNTVIEAVFNQPINQRTLSGNFVIARGVGRQGPRQPVLEGSVSSTTYAQNLVVAGARAYVVDGSRGGLYIVNIASSTHPERMGHRGGWGQSYNVQVAGNFAYIAAGDSGLKILDITSSTNPVVKNSSAVVASKARDVSVSGRYAYVAAGSNGLSVVDVASSTSPELLLTTSTPGIAYAVKTRGSYALVADGEAGLRVYNVSSLTAPRVMASLDTTGTAYSLDLQGNYAYVADGESGLRVVDISNPSSPTTTGSFAVASLTRADRVHISGSYAYVTGQPNNKIWIVDISNPRQPDLRYEWDVSASMGQVYAVKTAGDFAYVTDGEDKFYVFDLSFLTVYSCTGSEDVTSLVVAAFDNATGGESPPWYARLWRKMARFFGALFGSEEATATHLTIRSTKWCAGRDMGAATVAPLVGSATTSRVMINLRAPLAFDSDYTIILKEGIKDSRGVSIGKYGDLPHRWQFITSNRLCEVDEVRVRPSEHFFDTAGGSTILEAEARTSYGARIQSLPGYYAWNYLWGPENPYVGIASIATTSDVSRFATTTAKNRNGEQDVRASANIIDNLYTSAYGIVASGRARMIVYLCTNPWPPKDLYLGAGESRVGPYRIFPYEDRVGNNDGFDWVSSTFNNTSLPSATVPEAGDDGYFNFSTYYCADSGSLGVYDDLPYLRSTVQVTSTVTSATTSLKRFIFTSARNSDAIGIQIFPNPTHLSPSQWFGFATTSGGRGFRGQMQSLNVAGYPAVSDGDNVYVDALHYASSSRRLENYMYLFSVNDDAKPETRNVFEQMIGNARFNINMQSASYCGPSMDNPGASTTCESDLDCPGAQVCGNSVDKLKRDYARLRDLRQMQEALENYNIRNRPSINPVAAWDFGQGYTSGTARYVFPSSRGGHYAACVGNICPATTTDPAYGQVADFDVGDNAITAHHSALDMTEELTIEALVKWQGNSVEMQFYPLLAKGSVIGGITANYGLVLLGTGRTPEVAYPMFVSRNVLAVAPSLFIRENEWSNLSAVVKNRQVKFSVNGRMAFALQTLVPLVPNDMVLRLGNGFSGLIKRMAVYDSALQDSYPTLREGTYLTGQTISPWPSWTVLSGATGGALFPVDPVNRLGAVGTCTPSSTFFCRTDAECQNQTGSSTQRCTLHDPTTGWSAADRRFSFACATSSLAYRYFHSTSTGYILRGRLENPFADPLSSAVSNWDEFRNFFIDQTRVITEEPSGICTQAEEISTIDRGRCGDGRINVNLGEVCDPPNRLEIDRNYCANKGAGAKRERRCSTPSNDEPGCRWSAWTDCAVVSVCGNGVLEGKEQCDDGRLNGRYGRCSRNCTPPASYDPSNPSALPGYCGDGEVNPRFEACDIFEGLGGGENRCYGGVNDGQECGYDADCNTDRSRRSYAGSCIRSDVTRVKYAEQRTNSCNWDCQSYGPYCGDGTVQTEFGEECESGQNLTCALSDGRSGRKYCNRCRWQNPAASFWWRFDDAASTNGGATFNFANSVGSSGHGLCAPASTCPSFTRNGAMKGALEFDGANDFITVLHQAELVSPQFTIEAWVKPTEANRGGVIMEKGGELAAAESEPGGYGLEIRSDQKVKFNIWHVPSDGSTRGDAVANSVISNSTISTDAWTYLAGVYDGVTMKLYVNGVEEASTTLVAITFNEAKLLIGKSPGGGVYFKGLIDEVAYYNRALTTDEIRYKYQNNNVFCFSTSTLPVSAADSRCGNGRMEAGEACDRGAQNGVACAPTYGAACSYCSNDCRHIVNVLPAQYCGNGVIEGREACDTAVGSADGNIWSKTFITNRTDSVFSNVHNGYRALTCGEELNMKIDAGIEGSEIRTMGDGSQQIETTDGRWVRLDTPRKGNKQCVNNCQRLQDNCVECGIDLANGVEVNGSILNVLEPNSSRPLAPDITFPAGFPAGVVSKIDLHFAQGNGPPPDDSAQNSRVAYQWVQYSMPSFARFITYTLKMNQPPQMENGTLSPALINSNPLCSQGVTSTVEWRYRLVVNNDRQAKHMVDFPIAARPNSWQYDLLLSPIIRTTPYKAGGSNVIAARLNDARVVVSWAGSGEFYGGFKTPILGDPTKEGTSWNIAERTAGLFYYDSICDDDRCVRTFKKRGIWYHGFSSTEGGTRAEAFTVDTAALQGDRYAFYVRSPGPIQSFRSSPNRLKVDVYLPEDEPDIYRDDYAGDKSWKHFSQPSMTFYFSTATTSANPAAEYWHVFDISKTNVGTVVAPRDIHAVNRVRTDPTGFFR